jgi:sugar lactone lactonase YvrE
MRAGPECVWAVGAELGEGPVWSADALWFVDIKGRRIHRYGPPEGLLRTWSAPSPPGFLAPVAGGGWIAGLKLGLYRFDPATGVFDPLSEVEPDRPDNRLNDGCVDRQGRLWFGSMDDNEVSPTGRLYRLDPDASPAPCDDGYVVTNGPAFSPDGRTCYHTDTFGRAIYAFDVDERGRLSGKRLFAEVDRGYPDGPAVDAEGCLWTGLFGGWGLQRYAPSGRPLERIDFPVANVTKPAFGGPDLRTLYATTAWMGLSAAERAAQPLAGGLFAMEAETPGLAQMEVSLG